MKASPLISFIIPHKGRIELLSKTVDSICKQDYPSDRLEIIIVSQTESVRDTDLGDNSVSLSKIILPESATISMLRNHGVNQSSGDFIAFLDADIYIEPDWTTKMVALLESDPENIIVSGMQICEDSSPTLEKIRTCMSSIEHDMQVAFLPGCNMFLKRLAFDRIGGFPEKLIACEDYYFSDKANLHGRLYRTSDATYYHLGEDRDYWQMFRKEIWRGQSNLQSIRGRNITLRELPSFLIPVMVLILLVAALILVLTGHNTMAAICFLLGITPVIAYSIRLHRASGGELGLLSIIRFYLVYFPARAIGIILGAFRTISAKHE